MVRVVEQEREAARALAAEADPADEGRLVPLVHQHDVCTVGRRLDVELLRVVEDGPQLGKGAAELVHGAEAVLLEKVAAAPAVARLEDAHGVAAPHELARDAAQEMRVAVVPVGDDRVVEERDVHAATRAELSAEPYAATGKQARVWTLTPIPTVSHAAASSSSTCR